MFAEPAVQAQEDTQKNPVPAQSPPYHHWVRAEAQR